MVSKYSNVMKFHRYLLATNDVCTPPQNYVNITKGSTSSLPLTRDISISSTPGAHYATSSLPFDTTQKGFGTTPDRPRRTSHSETANDIGVGSIGVVNKSKTDMRREWAARAKW